jgi:hypothetical protein
MGNACNLYQFDGINWIDNSILNNLFDPLGNPVTEPFYFYGFNLDTNMYEIINVISLFNDNCEILTSHPGDKLLDCCNDVIYSYNNGEWVQCCDLLLPILNLLFPLNLPNNRIISRTNGIMRKNEVSKLITYSHSDGDSTIASGYASRADGIQTIAGGTGSYAGGILATTTLDGSWARASGGFDGTIGSCQFTLFNLGLESKSTNPDQIFSIILHNSDLIVPNNTAWTVDVSIVGADPTFKIFTSCKIIGLVINNNGIISMPSNPITNVISGTAGIPTLAVNNVNSSLKIIVTPISSATIRWNATVQVTNVSF